MSGPLVQRSYGRGAGAGDAYDALREFDVRPARTATRVVANDDAVLAAVIRVPLATAELIEPASYAGGHHQQQMQRQMPQRHTGAVMEPRSPRAALQA